jgi:hypothetical protein
MEKVMSRMMVGSLCTCPYGDQKLRIRRDLECRSLEMGVLVDSSSFRFYPGDRNAFAEV